MAERALSAAAANLAAADKVAAKLRRQRDDAILRCLDAGYSVAMTARLAGTSTTWVHMIRNREKGE